MFVSNKRINYPKTLKIESIDVKVVESFKLLGVELDNKLNFSKYISNLSKQINIKLFSMKRLFYLATSVKIQFFKTFILPYFDYCLSLIIYFPNYVIQRLCNIYYMCLFKLFNFKFLLKGIHFLRTIVCLALNIVYSID